MASQQGWCGKDESEYERTRGTREGRGEALHRGEVGSWLCPLPALPAISLLLVIACKNHAIQLYNILGAAIEEPPTTLASQAEPKIVKSSGMEFLTMWSNID